MDKINYALITALYDTKGADLYNDVYFPIIKYGIANQYYAQDHVEKYYDLITLQNSIFSDFGIKIPSIILKQSIRAIGNKENGIALSVYEKGKQYRIKKAWDISIKVSIDNKSQKTLVQFSQLEICYEKFLESKQLPFDKSLNDFYSDNTEDILNYMNQANGDSIIDEKYVNLARFLSWIKENDYELFNLANDIFWGSVVAGFLKRDTAEINIKSAENVEYFLDSSLVLSILGLDNKDNVTYSQELLEIIKSSGNRAMVHSLTIREISYILNSVAKEQGPRPNSAIEDAYNRLDLSPSKVLRMKNQLSNLIEEKGIIILNSTKKELDEIETEYKTKRSVNELKKERHTNNNSIRDIHDVFLRDFVLKKQNNISSIEKAKSFFVTLNSDLISYYNIGSVPTVIHPSKIVIDLWIHNSSSSVVKKNGLTQIISRCFAQNNTDIRRKLKLFSKYFKDSEGDFSFENYKLIFNSLIDRSTRALKEVEFISINEEKSHESNEEKNIDHIKALIRIGIEEDRLKKENVFALSSKLDQLFKNEKSKDQKISILTESHEKDQQRIKDLEIQREKDKKISILLNKIDVVSNKISELELLKKKSVSYLKYYLIILMEGIAVLVFIVCLFIFLYHYLNNEPIDLMNILSENCTLVFGVSVSALCIICRLKNIYLFSPKIYYNRHEEEQLNYWIKKNPDYNKLKSELSDLQKQQTLLCSSLSSEDVIK